MEVHIVRRFDLLRVNLQNGFTTRKVGQLHRNAAVKAAGARQRGIKRFRTVGRRQNDHTVVALKAIHFGQQLIQGLLALVVAAELAVTLFADGIDLVNENDAGCLFLSLLEEVAHLRRAHANEHLHKFRTGHGEKRHARFARDGLGQHGLAGTRRAYEQHALGHGRTDIGVFLWVVQIINDLRKVLLGLVLTRHIGKTDAVGGWNVDLGVALSHAEGHGVRPACLRHHLLGHVLSQGREDQDGQNKTQEKAEQRRHSFFNVPGKRRAGGVKAIRQGRIVHFTGLVDLFAVLVRKDDLGIIDLHGADVLVLDHFHKGAVVHFLHTGARKQRRHDHVEDQNGQQRNAVVINQRLFGRFDLFHLPHTPFWALSPHFCFIKNYNIQF